MPDEAVKEIAAILDLQPAEVEDTLTFYGFFKDEKHKLGKHRLWVCRSLPCMLRGGEELLVHLAKTLHLRPGQTTPDNKITLEFAECIGACEGTPCVLVNDEIKMNITHDAADRLVDELRKSTAHGDDLRTGAAAELGRQGFPHARGLMARQYQGARQGSGHGPRRRHQNRQGLRPTRPRRCRLPYRRQVAVSSQGLQG